MVEYAMAANKRRHVFKDSVRSTLVVKVDAGWLVTHSIYDDRVTDSGVAMCASVHSIFVSDVDHRMNDPSDFALPGQSEQ